MKPVYVFRFSDTEGAGHFATFLDENRISWKLIKLDREEVVPESSEPFAGLGFMGGPMSANDPTPWNSAVLALMRDAVERGVPVIGHCLGGQLLSKALGGTISRNPVKEIGWNRVRIEETSCAREWFGDMAHEFTTFQWHEDTFTIPKGAERVLTATHCANQGYVLHGRHLGLQCHVEMTPEMIESWCRTGGDDIVHNLSSPAVQSVERIKAEMPTHLPELSKTAERLYARWITNLRT